MSRSYKKHPVLKDSSHGHKKDKRYANKKSRKCRNLKNGAMHRKLYNRWNLYKQISYCSLEEFMKYPHLWKFYKTKEGMERAWRRSYYMK